MKTLARFLAHRFDIGIGLNRGMKTLGLVLFFFLFVSTLHASTNGFVTGDILVALTNGTVQVRAADGTLKTTLTGPVEGATKGLAFDAAGNLFVSYWWTADLTSGNTVVKFRRDGSYAGVFGSGYFCNPSGIVVDHNGNVYVGEADCDGNILKFDSAGNLLEIYDAAIEQRGARWIDLASDGCTMYYTSVGQHVQRYNVCTGVQLPNLNSIPLSSIADAEATGVRVMPGGGAMVADLYDVIRLDAAGNFVGLYDAAAENGFVGMFVDRDGTSFWTSSYETANVYKMDIATGQILMSFNIGVPGSGAKGVVIVPPPHTPPPPPPPPDSVPGRMTGGGDFYATNGTVVHHGFQLRCNVRDPRQNLEINWGKGQHFHLQTVTTVSCYDDPSINPGDPAAPIDTLVLSGTGTYNGTKDATIQLLFSDAGEPGRSDGVQLIIRDSEGNVVLAVSATTLIDGNQQAHRATGKQF
jgi:hypothetical protein